MDGELIMLLMASIQYLSLCGTVLANDESHFTRRLLNSNDCSDFIGCPDACIGGAWGTGCDCTYPNGGDADPNCVTCHSPALGEGPGCNQCNITNGYFKVDYNYSCTQCQEIFGDGCLHCTDFNGCVQCDEINGYTSVHVTSCGRGIDICTFPCPTLEPSGIYLLILFFFFLVFFFLVLLF